MYNFNIKRSIEREWIMREILKEIIVKSFPKNNERSRDPITRRTPNWINTKQTKLIYLPKSRHMLFKLLNPKIKRKS